MGYGTQHRVSCEVQPTNDPKCEKKVLTRYKNVKICNIIGEFFVQ
jgi:hypothetical protein